MPIPYVIDNEEHRLADARSTSPFHQVVDRASSRKTYVLA
jgi:hypothetical protein